MRIISSVLERMLVCAASFIVISAIAPAYAEERGQLINIEAQSLGGVINALARQTGAIIIVPSGLVEGKTSRALSGTFTAESALALLLAGTGLEAKQDASGAFVVQRQSFQKISTTGAAPAQGAAAQAAVANETSDEVVVVGFRQSLADARNAKRIANGIQDSIYAEDITDFPDLNLAESIQRIPGVYITRDGGEGRQVALRGLGPDYTRVRVNGVEALTTVGSTDQRGAVNRSRAFDFNVFASELFNQVDVLKSTSASLDEGGIAGTVDLSTAKPFDREGFRMAGAAQAFYSDRAEETTPRIAFLVSNTWGTEFGALFSAAYTDRVVVEDGVQTIRWQPGGTTAATGGWTLANVAPTVDPAIVARLNTPSVGGVPAANALFYPRTPRYFNFIHDQQRLGLTGALQWRPTESLSFDYDVLFARFEAERRENFLDAPSFTRTNSTGLPQTTIRDIAVSGNDIVFANLGNVDNRLDARRDQGVSDFIQHTVNGVWNATDRLTLRGLLGTTSSDFENDTLTLQALSDNNDFLFDFRGNDRVPLFQFGVSLTDPAPWRLDLYRPRRQEVGNDYETAKLEAEYDYAPFVLKTGASFTRYEFSARDFGVDVTTSGLIRGRAIGDLVQPLPYGFGGNFALPAGAPNSWIVIDLDGAEQTLNLAQFNAQRTTTLTDSNRDVREEVAAAYLQADFETSLLGQRLRGNLGVRVAQTKLAATGVVSGSPVTFDQDYTDTLPSLNLVWEPLDSLVVRFAANRNLTRPTLTSLTPGGSVSLTTRTIRIGNPELDPFRADSFDLSTEWYFSDDGYLAVSPFFKKVDVFIGSESFQAPYSETGLPVSFLGDQSQATPADLFTVIRPVNGGDADILGVEFLYQHDFKFLPGLLGNTGMVVNYTYLDSSAPVAVGAGISRDFPLPGVSEHSANATLYYETARLGGRVSVNYRDSYLTNTDLTNGNRAAGFNAATYVDVSAFYNVTDKLRLTFEGLNLTNEAEDQFTDVSDRVNSYAKSGAQFLFGLRYSY